MASRKIVCRIVLASRLCGEPFWGLDSYFGIAVPRNVTPLSKSLLFFDGHSPRWQDSVSDIIVQDHRGQEPDGRDLVGWYISNTHETLERVVQGAFTVDTPGPDMVEASVGNMKGCGPRSNAPRVDLVYVSLGGVQPTSISIQVR